MDKFAEIRKLNALLNEAGIPHTFGPCAAYCGEGYQIRIFADEELTNEIDDAICHTHSYGYANGLLETYVLSGCEGWETAEQIFKGWLKMYQEANEREIETCDCTIIGAGGEVWEGSAPSWD